MVPEFSCQQEDWLALALEALEHFGACSVLDALNESQVQELQAHAQTVEQGVAADLGETYQETLLKLGRIERQHPLKYAPSFLELLQNRVLRDSVRAVVGESATLRFQSLEIQSGESIELVQQQWHMNFRVFGQRPACLDVIFVLEDSDYISSCFQLVPGTHRAQTRPSESYMELSHITVPWRKGSVFLMDPRLWHRERAATHQTSQMLVHHLFVPHYVKPFFDYPRLLGEDFLRAAEAQARRYLGWNSRVPSSLQEFVLPPEERLYSAGQWET